MQNSDKKLDEVRFALGQINGRFARKPRRKDFPELVEALHEFVVRNRHLWDDGPSNDPMPLRNVA